MIVEPESRSDFPQKLLIFIICKWPVFRASWTNIKRYLNQPFYLLREALSKHHGKGSLLNVRLNGWRATIQGFQCHLNGRVLLRLAMRRNLVR